MVAMRRAMKLGAVVLAAFQAVWVALSLYQTGITVVGRLKGRPPAGAPGILPRFALIICARNEEAVISGILDDLLAQDYPRDHTDILVVAHNCTNRTAAEASARGANVIELATGRPGKAAAIRAGLAAIGDGWDFAGVFDADARVPADMLARVAEASAGEVCLQVETVPPESDEWLVAGYALGRRARNALWWRPREALGLGTTISGCGFFIEPHLLRDTLTGLRTMTEDLEATARLYAGGHRVRYVSSTSVRVGEPHQFAASMRQRSRWARGHFGVLLYEWPRLARRASRGDARAFDMSIYLAAPTRLLTRAMVSLSLCASLLRFSFALPVGIVVTAFCGEWAVPAFVSLVDGILPANRRGVSLALRHGVLSVLWFPIGLWAAVTPWSKSWPVMPRPVDGEESADAPAAA